MMYRLTDPKGTEYVDENLSFVESEMLSRWRANDGKTKRKLILEDNYHLEMYIVKVDENGDEDTEYPYMSNLYHVLVKHKDYATLMEYMGFKFTNNLLEEKIDANIDEVFNWLHNSGGLECYAEYFPVVANWLRKQDRRTYIVEIPLKGWYMTEVEAGSQEEAIELARADIDKYCMGEFVEEDEHTVRLVDGVIVDDHL